jgi:hypothetical protein
MSERLARKPPQPEALSESERDELRIWPSQHGMVILNSTDEELVIQVWRQLHGRTDTKALSSKAG